MRTSFFNWSYCISSFVLSVLIAPTSFCMDQKRLEFMGTVRRPRLSPIINLIPFRPQFSTNSTRQQTVAQNQNPRSFQVPRVISEEHFIGLISASEVREALDDHNALAIQRREYAFDWVDAHARALNVHYASVRTLVIYQNNSQMSFSISDIGRIFYLRNATKINEIIWIPYDSFKELLQPALGKPNAKDIFIDNLMRYITKERSQLSSRIITLRLE